MSLQDIEDRLAWASELAIPPAQFLREVRQLRLYGFAFHTGRGRNTVRGSKEAMNRMMHAITIAGPQGKSNW